MYTSFESLSICATFNLQYFKYVCW